MSVAAAASTVPSVQNRTIPAASELSLAVPSPEVTVEAADGSAVQHSPSLSTAATSAPHGSCAVPLIAHCGLNTPEYITSTSSSGSKIARTSLFVAVVAHAWNAE